MAINFLSNVKLNGAELQEFAIQNATSAPSNPTSGQVYYNTSDNFIYIYNEGDSSWDKVGVVYDLAVGAGAANTSTITLTGTDGTTDTVTISGTSNEIAITESGNTITVGLPDDVTIGNDLTVEGNLTVNGTTTTVNSTTVTVDDPIFVLGGDGAPTADDNKDRGIQFEWHDGNNAKTGFFGYDDSEGRFFVSADVSNASEVIFPRGPVVANSRGTNSNPNCCDAL